MDDPIKDLTGEVYTTPKNEYDSIGSVTPRANPNPESDLDKLLNIKWSKYIPGPGATHTAPRIPTAKQRAALMLEDVKELLYGGALGGGKSDYLAYEALRFCDVPGASSILFRRQLTDLKQPGALIPRIAEWLQPFKTAGECKYIAGDHKWEFKTVYPGTDIPGPPALLQFGYIGDAGVHERYQSAEYQFVGFDELGQWPNDGDWTFMASRCRITVCPIHGKDSEGNPIWHDDCHICAAKRRLPLRRRAAMNPGPAWVKRRFQIVPDPRQFKTKREALVAIQEGIKVNWVGIHPEFKFIPAKLEDNPHLSEHDYREMLAHMSDEERSRLEDGNWEARKDSRFQRRWITDRYYHIYNDGYIFLNENYEEVGGIHPFSSLRKVFTTSDCAATSQLFDRNDPEARTKAGVKKKPSATALGVWGETYDGQLLWLDCRKFRREIPDIVENIAELNEIWHPQYNKIEINGLGIGVAQYVHLAGYPVQKNHRKTDKLENSIAAQMMMRGGQIWFPLNAPWIEEREDDIFNWTGDPEEEDDVVDILSDAALEITPAMAKKVSGPTYQRKMPQGIPTLTPGGIKPIAPGMLNPRLRRK